jgi:hypothetical protein
LKRFAVPILLVLLAALLVPLLAACGTKTGSPSTKADPSGTTSTLDGQTLVEQRCTVCHSLRQVTQARKTEQGWRQTVQRMVSYGAQLNQQEEQVVIQYLAQTYPAQ